MLACGELALAGPKPWKAIAHSTYNGLLIEMTAGGGSPTEPP